MQTKYNQFSSTVDADNWINDYKNCFPSDDDADKEFLCALHYYTASANTLVNNALRYNMEILENDYMQPTFQQMISKLPTYQIPDNIIVYRYISKGLLKEMVSSYPAKKGVILIDKGFMSTTLVRKSILNHKKSDISLKILLEISVPKGSKGTYVGHLKNMLSEYEVILAPNTKLRIDYKRPFFNNYYKCTIINH